MIIDTKKNTVTIGTKDVGALVMTMEEAKELYNELKEYFAYHPPFFHYPPGVRTLVKVNAPAAEVPFSKEMFKHPQ